MESNISRDHIALEAMKIHLNKSLVVRRTIFNRIACALGFGTPKVLFYSNLDILAGYAYLVADAMIAERENKVEEEKEDKNK